LVSRHRNPKQPTLDDQMDFGELERKLTSEPGIRGDGIGELVP